MKNLYLLILFLNIQIVSGQIIDGTVFYDRDKPVSLARIDFICDLDTFYTTYTNEAGYFEYCEEYCLKNFTISASKKDYIGDKFSFVIDDTIYRYIINLNMIRMMVDNFCNVVFFEVNEFDDLDFDVKSFKELLEEYTMLCAKTHCVLYPGESEKLAEKRLKSLKKHFIQWQIPVERIEFSSEVNYMRVRTDEQADVGCPDLPYISFSVTSMEGDCLK